MAEFRSICKEANIDFDLFKMAFKKSCPTGDRTQDALPTNQLSRLKQIILKQKEVGKKTTKLGNFPSEPGSSKPLAGAKDETSLRALSVPAREVGTPRP